MNNTTEGFKSNIIQHTNQVSDMNDNKCLSKPDVHSQDQAQDHAQDQNSDDSDQDLNSDELGDEDLNNDDLSDEDLITTLTQRISDDVTTQYKELMTDWVETDEFHKIDQNDDMDESKIINQDDDAMIDNASHTNTSTNDSQINETINELDRGYVPLQQTFDVDKTVNPDKAIDLVEKFLRIYNVKNKVNGSMFEGVDPRNSLMINDKMETFWEYVDEYKTLENENSEYVDVYGPGDVINNPNSYDIYALITDKNETKYISLSFLSLLYVGSDEFNDNIGWNIVKL